MVLYMSPV